MLLTPSGDALRFLEDSQKLPFEWRSVLRFFEEDAGGNPFEVDLGNERAGSDSRPSCRTYGDPPSP